MVYHCMVGQGRRRPQRVQADANQAKFVSKMGSNRHRSVCVPPLGRVFYPHGQKRMQADEIDCPVGVGMRDEDEDRGRDGGGYRVCGMVMNVGASRGGAK